MKSNNSDDQIIPEQPQVTPSNNIELHPHLLRAIEEQVTKQVASLKLSSGGNMSDSTISKDWIERKLSDLDNKIEMEKVKSDTKFERLFSELKSESEKMALRIDARFAQTDSTIARSETNITRWIMAVILSIIGLGFAMWRSSQSIATNYESLRTSISEQKKQEEAQSKILIPEAPKKP